MIIDCEHHFYPEELLRKHGVEPGGRTIQYEDGVPRLALHYGLCHMDRHLEAMDQTGIDKAVLMAWDHPLDECKVINDSLARLMKEHPGRFVGAAHVPPLGGKEALAELDRAINGLGLKGVVMTAQVRKLPIDSRELFAFYDAVSRLGQPIFVHPSATVWGFDALNSPLDLGRSLGRELDLATGVVRLILGGVLEEFPDLKFIVSHMGGGISAILERIAFFHHAGTDLPRPIPEYFARIYFSMAGYEGGMNAVRCALTSISPERMLFATDYPQNFGTSYRKGPEGMGEYIEDIRKLELDDGAKEGMLGKNAAELLGL